MIANALTAREDIRPGQLINTSSRLPWIKIFGMLNQSWAYVDDCAGGKARIWFVKDLGDVFDLIDSPSRADAEAALVANDWDKYTRKMLDCESSIGVPERPFKWAQSPIYSSGEFGTFTQMGKGRRCV